MESITQLFSQLAVNTNSVSTDLGSTNSVSTNLVHLSEHKIKYSDILYYELGFSQENYDIIFNYVIKNLNDIKKKENYEIIKNNLNDIKNNLNDIKKNENNIIKFADIPDSTKSSKFAKSLKESDTFMKLDNAIYTLKDEFHITVLYTGGKQDDRADSLQEYLGQKFNIQINQIGYNQHFISVGISIIGDLPYYGNDIKHITFGLNNFTLKKALPKDSYTALLTDNQNIIHFDSSSGLIVETEFNVKTK